MFFNKLPPRKAARASFASLKCWRPKGIPMIVTHSRIPSTQCSIARGRPERISQRIFSRKDPAPPPYCTSLPKGKKLSPANLKHCIPTGIPTMVMHQRHPARHQLRPLKAPPKINHNKFPRQPIFIPPLPLFPEFFQKFFYQLDPIFHVLPGVLDPGVYQII